MENQEIYPMYVTYETIRKSLNKIQHTKDNHKKFYADCRTCVDTYLESQDKE
jgi:hypothetical protein